MIVLAVDTALAACSAAVVDGERVRAALSEPMTRGHQERLAPMVAEAMIAAGLAFSDLDRVAVTTGPGSFTGLRVGLAFARTLALARGLPCVGVNTLEALAGDGVRPVVAAIPAPHSRLYWQAFAGGADEPELVELAVAQAKTATLAPMRLVGPAADALAAFAPRAIVEPVAAPRSCRARPPRGRQARARQAPSPRLPPPRGCPHAGGAGARVSAVLLRPLQPSDAGALAQVHAEAFDRPWPAEDFDALMRHPGAVSLGAGAGPRLNGFILVRRVLDEAEVMTLAVRPAARRSGLARALIEASADLVRRPGPRRSIWRWPVTTHRRWPSTPPAASRPLACGGVTTPRTRSGRGCKRHEAGA